jgi:hypothetical protein
MKRFWIFKGLKFLVLGAVLIFVFSGVTMWAWNYVLPHVLHVHGITYWQALALLLLIRIFFFRGWGGWHRGGPHGGGWHGWQSPYYKKMMEERLSKMSPEQRELAKKYWEYKCGGWKKTEESSEPGTETSSEKAG